MSTGAENAAVGLSKDRLDEVVNKLKEFMSRESIRVLNQRAVQGKAWHLVPEVAMGMTDLRREEEQLRCAIMRRMSKLVYGFHEHTVNATLARAGVLQDDRLHAGSSLNNLSEFDLLCLDAKERLYLIFKQYGWLEDFFRHYPQHFYENSFVFVNNIPNKQMPVSVTVVGMGIAGSLAVSGLAKVGIKNVTGFEHRARGGSHGVSSRYQNASWRAYDISENMLDAEAFEHLCAYRQRINVKYDDGSSKILTTDRVQIIIGDAVDSALQSAERYGAKLCFGSAPSDYFNPISSSGAATATAGAIVPHVDIVALFAGVHTSNAFAGLAKEMQVDEWPGISSDCKMWLSVRESEHHDAYCTRGGEIGAERWHYTIDSARSSVGDIMRVQHALDNQRPVDYNQKTEQLGKVLAYMTAEATTAAEKTRRFDYVFTNAPDNEHNRNKRALVAADGSVVFDGAYTVDIKLASRCVVAATTVAPLSEDAAAAVSKRELLAAFGTNVIVTGGDACVPPNPLAAYGATLACEAADMLVQLAVATAHINAVVAALDTGVHSHAAATAVHIVEWHAELQVLKALFAEFYNVRGRAENYFQWIQTLICNLYSLPPLVVPTSLVGYDAV